MNLNEHLLTDAQMHQFISDGYLVLNADFPQEFHQQMQGKIEEFMDKEGNPGNNFLPRLPETQEVFNHPTIRGALTSVLGESYIMHPHRHCHYSKPGRTVQRWHKDSYWGFQKIRNHHQWWAMIFYYPQDTVMEMGPSGILPGTQFYSKRADENLEREVHMEGDAGTFALIHYDLWHRGTDNVSQRNRSMMKFQFVRMDAPTGPTWNHQDPDADAIPALVDLMADTTEPVAINASYALAAMNGAAMPALADALHSNNLALNRNAGYALSTFGDSAVPDLLAALESDNEQTRGYAAFALGEIGSEAALEKLAEMSANDSSEWVRRSVVEALGTLESRYVRANAVDALRQIGTPEAMNTAMDHLIASRWCPITTPENLF